MHQILCEYRLCMMVFSSVPKEETPFWVENIKCSHSVHQIVYEYRLCLMFDGFCSSIPREATPFWVENIRQIDNSMHQIVYEYRLCLMVFVVVSRGKPCPFG
jgi:hypothetical protein